MAFAAVLGNGHVVTWGRAGYGGDSAAVQEQLRDVQHISSTVGVGPPQYKFNKFNKFGGKANPPNLLNLCWPSPLAKKSGNAFRKRVSRFVMQKSVNAFGKRVYQTRLPIFWPRPPRSGGFPNFNNLLNLLNLLKLLELYWGDQYKFNRSYPPNTRLTS